VKSFRSLPLLLGLATTPALAAFDASLSASVDTNLAGLDEAEHASSLGLSFAPLYTFSEKLTLAGQFALAQDLSGENEMTAQDGLVSASFLPMLPHRTLKLRWSAAFSLPFSEASHARAGLRTTLSGGPTLSLNGEAVGAPWLRLSYRLTGLRSFHAYTTSTSGRSNAAWGLSQRVDAGFALSRRLSLTLIQGFTTIRTYDGAATSSFRFGQELGLQIHEHLSFEMGHTNGGSLYKPDGETTNLALMGRESSSIYGGMTYAF